MQPQKARGTPLLKPQDQTRRQPNRSPPIQHPLRLDEVLSRQRYRCRSVRPTGPRAAHEAPRHRGVEQEVQLYAGAVDDLLESTAWICAAAEIGQGEEDC